MNIQKRTIAGKSITRFCSDPCAPVMYVIGSAEISGDSGWTVVSVEEIDWNRELSPWPAKAVFRGQADFGGGAEAFLKELARDIIPAVEADLQPKMRAVCGYSLAGLFSVYAAMETDLFGAAASVSGSMWYPGFADFVCQREKSLKAAYFSVGDREKLGRNRAFHTIEEDTKRIAAALEARGAKTVFELNPGGHFVDPAGRMRRAAQWLAQALI